MFQLGERENYENGKCVYKVLGPMQRYEHYNCFTQLTTCMQRNINNIVKPIQPNHPNPLYANLK